MTKAQEKDSTVVASMAGDVRYSFDFKESELAINDIFTQSRAVNLRGEHVAN